LSPSEKGQKSTEVLGLRIRAPVGASKLSFGMLRGVKACFSDSFIFTKISDLIDEQ
jgi:hypothetical protein